jgi:hypothetical protein
LRDNKLEIENLRPLEFLRLPATARRKRIDSGVLTKKQLPTDNLISRRGRKQNSHKKNEYPPIHEIFAKMTPNGKFVGQCDWNIDSARMRRNFQQKGGCLVEK